MWFDYQGNSKSLLKYYSLIETPNLQSISLPTTGVETGLQVPLNLKYICPNDRVELIATIDWLTTFGGSSVVTAEFLPTAEAVTSNETDVYFFAETQITFNVYRDGIQIFNTMDYRALLYWARIPSTITSTDLPVLQQIPLIPLVTTNTGTPPTATTTFQCFDTGASKEEHVYTITAQLGNYAIVSSTTCISTTSIDLPLIPVYFFTTVFQPIAVVSLTNFSGKVIDENKNLCHDSWKNKKAHILILELLYKRFDPKYSIDKTKLGEVMEIKWT